MTGRLRLDDCEIDYRLVPGESPGPALVFLHEGLGSVSAWRDFPDRLARAAGLPALVYSRKGYGNSSPPGGGFAIDYMHVEALERLPAVLEALDIARPVLVGHSDGASIALIHAGTFPDRVRGLVAMAPHIFVEPCTRAAIEAARRAFEECGLGDRLARHHRDARGTFAAWNDAWLDPAFQDWNIEAFLPAITAPLLAIQGEDDPYGTMRQVEETAAATAGPADVLRLADCGHAPWREREDRVTAAILDFLAGLGGAG